MTTSTAVLRSPGALVASVPHLLGFIPKDSVVGIWLTKGSVLVTQRADLGVISDPQQFYGPLLGKGADEIIIVTYGESDKQQLVEFAETVANAFDDCFFIRDVIQVRGNRWFSAICNDPSCCPPEGKEIKPEDAIELIGAGIAPVESRDALLEECRPQGKRNTRSMPAAGKLEDYRDESIAAFTNVIAGWMSTYDPSDIGVMRELGRSLHDIRVRDTVLYDITKMNPDTLDVVYSLLREVCKASTPEQAAPACSVTSIVTWMAGDGARANVALDYALEANLEYSLALLIKASLASGLPPAAWRDSMNGLNRDMCRHGSE